MEMIMHFKRYILIACLFFPLTLPALSIKDLPINDRALDSSIPAPEDVIGSAIGSRHLFHYEILKYMRFLAEASPRMVAQRRGKKVADILRREEAPTTEAVEA